MKYLRGLLIDESGATAVEYSLIAALIALATVAAIGNYHEKLGGTYTYVATAIGGAM